MKNRRVSLKAVVLLMFVMFVIIGSAAVVCTLYFQRDRTVTNDITVAVPIDEDFPASLQTKLELRFQENGEYKIATFSDVQCSYPLDDKTIQAMDLVIKSEKPDFIMYLGDNSIGINDAETLRAYVTQLTLTAEEMKIPWSYVYGNHDDEGGVTKEEQFRVYSSFAYCVAERGPSAIHGVCNYVLPVKEYKSEKIVFDIWGLDSNRYLGEEIGNSDTILNDVSIAMNANVYYDFIRFDQIQWYYETSQKIEAYQGKKVPGLMFFHIALPEYRLISSNPSETSMTGTKNEEECNSPINSGLFAALLQRGDVCGVYVGHDHTNEYVGKYCGIDLGYVPGIGFSAYGYGSGVEKDKFRGARIFEIKESHPQDYKTRMVYPTLN